MTAANRIIKNTGILYAKMGITMFITLYSTRLILNALGAEDFGIFNLVGGVIAMLTFLNASLASATQRFMSYSEGAGDLNRKRTIFNVSVLLHFIIAIFVVIILEITGYFFFHGILNIPGSRLASAKIIYHFMVISTMFTIMSVPYDAVIISHENMLLYSITGIIESLLKLTVALYVTYTVYDKLIVYGGLMALITLFILVIYRIYCHKKYDECQINFSKYMDKSQMKEMGSFAAWSFSGYASGMLGNYGLSIVLNIFFGTVLNAAQGIANQVSGQLMAFSNTMLRALNPIIVKSEGAGDRQLMLKASMSGSKISFLLLSFFSIPFFIETPYVLKIWLKNVPEWTVIFCRFNLIRSLIDQLTITLGTTIGAEGRIASFSKIISILNIIPLPIIYVLFKLGYPPYVMYIVAISFWSIGGAYIHLYFAKINCSLSIPEFYSAVLLRSLLVFVGTFIISYLPTLLLEEGALKFLTTTTICTVSFLIFTYTIGLTKEEKKYLTMMKQKIVNRKKNDFK